MKKLVTIIGVVLLVGVMTYPVFARGRGWGGGCDGWGPGGNQGGGPGNCRWNQGANSALTSDQRSKLNSLDQKFFNETSTLRNEIWNKKSEMTLLLNGDNPDAAKLQALQKDISELKGQMAQKRLAHRLETRKVAPESDYGRGYGKGRGGYGGNGGGRCRN